MKYCKKCKHIYEDNQEICTECKKPQPLYEIEETNTPVYLMSASGFEIQRVQSALEDGGIPSDNVARKNNISADAVTGSDFNDRDILVPYSAYEKAYEICVGIGAIKPEGEEIKVEQADIDAVADGEEEVQMSPAKRTTVKIISAILLILIFCGIIWGTDYIAEFIKGLFS